MKRNTADKRQRLETLFLEIREKRAQVTDAAHRLEDAFEELEDAKAVHATKLRELAALKQEYAAVLANLEDGPHLPPLQEGQQTDG